jgi:molybdenum cofactor biosynthesis enzyme
MCKALERGMTIGDVYVTKKSGGRSGLYLRPQKRK